MRALTLLVILAILVALSLQWLWPVVEAPILPAGEQTLTGILNRAPLSRTRRGTHVLSQDGRNLCLVESTTVNLQPFEGKTVTLKGTLMANTEEGVLPVLVVKEATTTQGKVRREEILSRSIALSVPTTWVRSGTDLPVTFTTSGATTPVLTLTTMAGTLTGDSNLTVDGHAARRTVDSRTGSATVAIDLGNGSQLLIAYDPPGSDPLGGGAAVLQQVLQSVELPASVHVPGTGSGVGLPCGGPAGFLCPTGLYCEVTDTQLNIGTCALP